MPIRCLLLCSALAFVGWTTTGCAALLDAGGRELRDHGDNAKYENKSYGEHFLDSLLEDDDDDDCRRYRHRTTVIVERG